MSRKEDITIPDQNLSFGPSTRVPVVAARTLNALVDARVTVVAAAKGLKNILEAHGRRGKKGG